MPYKDADAQRAFWKDYRERPAVKAKRTAARRARQQAVRDHVYDLKRERGCEDGRMCNPDVVMPHYLLEFDHVRGTKEFNIFEGVQRGMAISKLDSEIAKCDVVCSNCHKQRTHERRP